ncbi:EthD domain-containing protein [Rhizobium sp. Root1204]|uniref:EthD domain-containing protein n=1 Tax=Rhizobium sp. Root1204 TaxID=1736428 RepID=UPI000713FFFD|nr:EthD domain-containing protein [Rhizobium sp. Root1204]KQV41309.1 hypothetical protein ASC96_18625 [Rhizobium sp. Root1204]
MVKRITLLRQRPDMSREAFGQHWAGPHADIAIHFPALAAYNQNRVDRSLWKFGPSGLQVDGIVELWFESEQGMRDAGQSDVTRQLIEDEPRFLSGITGLMATEREKRQGMAGARKVFLLGHADDPLSALSSLFNGTSFSLAGDTLAPSFTREALWNEPTPPNVAIAMWIDNEADSIRKLAQSVFTSAELYEVDTLTIV